MSPQLVLRTQADPNTEGIFIATLVSTLSLFCFGKLHTSETLSSGIKSGGDGHVVTCVHLGTCPHVYVCIKYYDMYTTIKEEGSRKIRKLKRFYLKPIMPNYDAPVRWY